MFRLITWFHLYVTIRDTVSVLVVNLVCAIKTTRYLELWRGNIRETVAPICRAVPRPSQTSPAHSILPLPLLALIGTRLYSSTWQTAGFNMEFYTYRPAASNLNIYTSYWVFLQWMQSAENLVIKDWIIQFALVPPPLRAAYLAFVALRLSGHKQWPVVIE